MASEHINTAEGAEPIEGSHTSTKTIWKVFWYLFFITAIEFVIALAVPETIIPRGYKNFIFIALTILKAFYIVAFFMHLKFERISLIYTVLVPLIFVIGFIAAMLFEGDYWLMIR